MRRMLIAATSLIAVATLLVAGGRPNLVYHEDDHGWKFIEASGGSCRHHLSAHPLDRIYIGGTNGDPAQLSQWTQDSSACQ